MTRDVSIEAAGQLVVMGWRSGEQGLHLKVRGQPDEIRLLCRCGRWHWIVREQFPPEGARLLLSCHACGTRREFFLEGASLPPR